MNALAPYIIDHVTYRRPASTITAPCPTVGRSFTGVDADNRDAYIAQSAATRNGVVAQFRLRQKPRVRVKPRIRIEPTTHAPPLERAPADTGTLPPVEA